MSFFSRFNPVRPAQDLRLYFHRRGPVELGFLCAALIATGTLIGLFVIDTPTIPPPEKQIIYVQQWRADRTDAEIKAQQAKDKPKEDAEKARVAGIYAKHREELKRLDNSMKRWGLF